MCVHVTLNVHSKHARLIIARGDLWTLRLFYEGSKVIARNNYSRAEETRLDFGLHRPYTNIWLGRISIGILSIP